jgi:hypothetical protein
MMKRWNELTSDQKQNLRHFMIYLLDEGDNGFDAHWDAFVIEKYQEHNHNLERTLQFFNPEDRAEAQAVIHSWEKQ